MVTASVIKQQLLELQTRAEQLQVRIKPNMMARDRQYVLINRKLTVAATLIGSTSNTIAENKDFTLADILEYTGLLHTFQELISALHIALYEYKTEDRKVLDVMNNFVNELYERIDFAILDQRKPDPLCVAYGNLVAHSAQLGILMTPHNDIVYFWNWGLLAHEVAHVLASNEKFMAKVEAQVDKKKIMSEFKDLFSDCLRVGCDYTQVLTRWNVELVCDIIGFMLAGAAYSYPFVDRIINPTLSVTTMDLERTHPLDEIRYRLQLRLLEYYYSRDEATLVKKMWGTVIRTHGPETESDYEKRGELYEFASSYAKNIMKSAETIDDVIKPLTSDEMSSINQIIRGLNERPANKTSCTYLLNALWISYVRELSSEKLIKNVRRSIIRGS